MNLTSGNMAIPVAVSVGAASAVPVFEGKDGVQEAQIADSAFRSGGWTDQRIDANRVPRGPPSMQELQAVDELLFVRKEYGVVVATVKSLLGSKNTNNLKMKFRVREGGVVYLDRKVTRGCALTVIKEGISSATSRSGPRGAQSLPSAEAYREVPLKGDAAAVSTPVEAVAAPLVIPKNFPRRILIGKVRKDFDEYTLNGLKECQCTPPPKGSKSILDGNGSVKFTSEFVVESDCSCCAVNPLFIMLDRLGHEIGTIRRKDDDDDEDDYHSRFCGESTQGLYLMELVPELTTMEDRVLILRSMFQIDDDLYEQAFDLSK